MLILLQLEMSGNNETIYFHLFKNSESYVVWPNESLAIMRKKSSETTFFFPFLLKYYPVTQKKLSHLWICFRIFESVGQNKQVICVDIKIIWHLQPNFYMRNPYELVRWAVITDWERKYKICPTLATQEYQLHCFKIISQPRPTLGDCLPIGLKWSMGTGIFFKLPG